MSALFCCSLLELVFPISVSISTEMAHFPPVTLIFDLWPISTNLTYIRFRWATIPNTYIEDHFVRRLWSEHRNTHTAYWLLYTAATTWSLKSRGRRGVRAYLHGSRNYAWKCCTCGGGDRLVTGKWVKKGEGVGGGGAMESSNQQWRGRHGPISRHQSPLAFVKNTIVDPNPALYATLGAHWSQRRRTEPDFEDMRTRVA